MGNADKLDILPDRMRERLLKTDGMVVLADDDSTLTGAAIFSYGDRDEEMNFEYIYVAENFRGQGISAGIMDTATAMMKKAGVKKLGCVIAGVMEEIVPEYTFLLANCFTPVVLFNHFMDYRIQDILDNKLFAMLLNKHLNSIKSKKEIPENVLKKYGNDMYQNGNRINAVAYDEELSLFYIKEDQIKGCMLVRSHDNLDEAIYISDLPKEEDAIAIPGMIAVCARQILQKRGKDGMLRVYVRQSELYEALVGVMGDAGKQTIVQEYEKILQ